MEYEQFYLSLQSQNESEGVLQNGVIAQLVEQRTENPCVPGSIPGDTTLKIRELQKCDSLFCAVLSPVSRLFYDSKFSVCPNAAAFVTIDAAVGEVKDLEHHTIPEPAFLIDSILFMEYSSKKAILAT